MTYLVTINPGPTYSVEVRSPSSAPTSLTGTDLISPNIVDTPTFNLSLSGAQNFRDATLNGNGLLSPAVIRPYTPGDITMGRYGAVGMGSTAVDTQAWLDAWEDVIAADGGTITLPPGVFLIEEPYISTTALSDITRGVTVKGQGQRGTTIEQSAGLLAWNLPGSGPLRLEMSDLQILMAAGGNNGDIFSISRGAVPGVRRGHDVLIDRVDVRPKDRTVDYANRVFAINKMYFPLVRQCQISGPYGPGVSTATQQQGTAALDFDESYGPRAENCGIRSAATGIRFVVESDPGGEGGTFFNNVIDAGTGIYMESAGQEPGGNIRGGHLNCANMGIHLVNKLGCTINDILFYNEEIAEGDEDPTVGYLDINLDQCRDVVIDGNRFRFRTDPDRVNIDIGGNCNNIRMLGNYHSAGLYAVRVAAGAEKVYLLDPLLGTNIDQLLENAAGDEVTVRHMHPPRITGRRTGVQTISNATDTRVGFQVYEQEVGNWSVSGPGNKFTVPTRQGVRHVRCTANIPWASNSTGERALWVTVNGADVPGMARITRSASGLSQLNITTGSIAVDGGDEIRFEVRQTSGADLDITFGDDMWCEIVAVQV